MPDFTQALNLGLWLMLGAIVGIAGVYAAMATRRWMHREEQRETFTLQDLREMRDRGEITLREYEAMRAAIIGQTSKASQKNTGDDG